MDTIVDSEWVVDHLDGVHLVDVRDAWEYEGIGHLPGAVNVPFDSFRSEEDGEGGMLPGAAAFAELVGSVGIENGDEIVAYDDMHGVFAARFLVTCELYGHSRESLHLLDGDYSSWSREQEVSRSAPETSSVEYEASFVEDGPLVDLSAVESAMDDPESILVDTREEWEFEEGHIPGAIQLDWLELVNQEERGLKPETEIRSLLEARDITPDRRIVLYCNTARRISHTYTVLRHFGYEHLAFYEGSLTEWEREGGSLAQ